MGGYKNTSRDQTIRSSTEPLNFELQDQLNIVIIFNATIRYSDGVSISLLYIWTTSSINRLRESLLIKKILNLFA